MTKPSLNDQIAAFYDASSGLWETVWGAHMHHGYYGPEGRANRDPRRAQIDMIDRLLAFGDVAGAQRVLDVGCGVGGSALLLADRFGAEATGITLSPVQARRAGGRAREADLADRTRFLVADALDPPFEPGSFDLVWSLESGEHMPEKPRFIRACADLLAPGGRFLMAVWCRRPLPPPLSRREERLLGRLYEAYHLPPFIDIGAYADLARAAGLTDVRTGDWTRAVAPFWGDVVRSALRPSSLLGLLRAGLPTLRGALAMRFMVRGYRTGLIRFGVLRGTQP